MTLDEFLYILSSTISCLINPNAKKYKNLNLKDKKDYNIIKNIIKKCGELQYVYIYISHKKNIECEIFINGIKCLKHFKFRSIDEYNETIQILKHKIKYNLSRENKDCNVFFISEPSCEVHSTGFLNYSLDIDGFNTDFFIISKELEDLVNKKLVTDKISKEYENADIEYILYIKEQHYAKCKDQPESIKAPEKIKSLVPCYNSLIEKFYKNKIIEIIGEEFILKIKFDDFKIENFKNTPFKNVFRFSDILIKKENIINAVLKNIKDEERQNEFLLYFELF